MFEVPSPPASERFRSRPGSGDAPDSRFTNKDLEVRVEVRDMGLPANGAEPHTSFEVFYADRAQDLVRYVERMLSEVTGGGSLRIAAADALQEGMLRIYREWPQLEGQSEDDRDRCVYRVLRLATLDLVRRESGRGQRHVAYPVDFQSLETDLDSSKARDREMAVAVLGRMSVVVEESPLDYGSLVGGLASLSEREAVVFTAVEGLGWEQTALADKLGMDVSRLYETLHDARKLFYGFVRHAHGVELEEEERARLHALHDGRLTSRERRRVCCTDR